jgi:hypothetical protein
MIVGEAEVRILADESGFETSLKDGTKPGLDGLAADAELAGADAGVALRDGAAPELDGLAADLGASGQRGHEQFVSGTKGAGDEAGKGVRDEMQPGLQGVEKDMEGAGETAGASFTGKIKQGLSGLATALTGVGFGDFSKAAGGAGNALDNVGGKAAESGGFFNTLGKVSLIAGVAGFVAFSAAALKMGVDFQTAVTKMAAQGNIPIKTANDIGQAFLHSGSDTIYSAQEMVSAFGGVAGQLGAMNGKALTTTQSVAFMKTSMDLAEESGNSLSSTTKDLSQVMQTFSVPLKDAGTTSIALFNASRITNVGLDSLTQTVDRLKARLGVTAPSIQDLSTLMVDAGEHGVTGSRGLMTLNTAMTTLLKPSTAVAQAQLDMKTAIDALPPSLQKLATQYQAGNLTATQVTAATKGLTQSQADSWKAFTTADAAMTKANQTMSDTGIHVVDAQGKFVGLGSVIAQLQPKLQGMSQAQQLATLSTLIGTTANKALLNTILAGPAAYDKAQKAVESAAAAHHALVVQQQTLGHEFDAIKVQVTNMTTSFGTELLPIVRDALGDFGKFFAFLEDHKPVLYVVAAAIGTVLAAAIAVYVVNTGQKMVDATGRAIASLSKLLGGTEATSAATTEAVAPQEALSAALEATAAAQQAVIDGAREMAIAEAEASGSSAELAALAGDMAASDAAAAIGADGLAASFDAEAASAAVADAATLPIAATIGIVVVAVAALGIAIYELVAHWSTVWGEIKRIFDDVVGFLTHGFGQFAILLLGPIAPLVYLALHWKETWQIMETVVSDAVNWIKGHLDIVAIFAPWLAGIVFVATHWQATWHAITSVLDIAKGVISADIQAAEAIFGAFVAMVQSAMSVAVGAFHIFMDGVQELENAVRTGIGVVEFLFVGLPEKILGALAGAGQWLLNVGKDIINGLVKGVESMAAEPAKAVEKIAHGIVGVAKDILGVFSPSTVFHQIGADSMKGLANGIKENAQLAQEEMKALKLAEQLVPELQKIEAAGTKVGNALHAIVTGLIELASAGRTAQQGVVPVVQAIEQIAQALAKAGNVRLPPGLQTDLKSLATLATSLQPGPITAAIAAIRAGFDSLASSGGLVAGITRDDAALKAFTATLKLVDPVARQLGTAIAEASTGFTKGATEAEKIVQAFDKADTAGSKLTSILKTIETALASMRSAVTAAENALGTQLVKALTDDEQAANRIAPAFQKVATEVQAGSAKVRATVADWAAFGHQIDTTLTSVARFDTDVKQIATSLTTAAMKGRQLGDDLLAVSHESTTAATGMTQLFHALTLGNAPMVLLDASLKLGDKGLSDFQTSATSASAGMKTFGIQSTATQTVLAKLNDELSVSVKDTGDVVTNLSNMNKVLLATGANFLIVFNQTKTLGLDMLRTNLQAFVSFWQTEWLQMQTVVQTFNSTVTPIFNQLRTAEDQLRTSTDTLKTDWGNDWQDITTATSSVWTTMSGTFQNIKDQGLTPLDTAIGQLKTDWDSDWQAMGQTITSVFGNDPGSYLYNTGEAMVQGLINGINSKGSQVSTTLTNIVNSAVTSAKAAAGTHSPSTIFHEIGKNMMEGLANGIQASAQLPVSALTGVAADLRAVQVTAPALQPQAPLPTALAAPGAPTQAAGGATTIYVQQGAFQVHNHGAVSPAVADASTAAVRSGITELSSALLRGANPNRMVPLP